MNWTLKETLKEMFFANVVLSVFCIVTSIAMGICFFVIHNTVTLAIAVSVSLFLLYAFLTYENLDSTIIKRVMRSKNKK